MTNGDDGGQRVLSLRSHRRVESGWGVDIKTGVGWQVQVADNAVEVLAVIICKKKSVRGERSIGSIHSQEKADDRAGMSLAFECLHLPIGREKILINVRQVGACQHRIR